VSTQQEPAIPVPGTKEATVAEKAEKKVYRLPGPQVMWWVWVVFVAANLLDLAIQGHNYESLQIAVGLLAITGLVYACTLRPRVIADAGGLTMINPLRDYRIPWPRIAEIYLAESVQFKCSEGDGASGKTLHSWALYSPRKAKLKADIRGRRWERGAVRGLGTIQMARRLPETTGIVPNLVEIRLIRRLPAHHRLALKRDLRARVHLRQGQRPSRLPPYPLTAYALQGLGGKWLSPAWHR